MLLMHGFGNINTLVPGYSCTNLESFVRGGPNLIMFYLVDEEIEDQNINGTSMARQ